MAAGGRESSTKQLKTHDGTKSATGLLSHAQELVRKTVLRLFLPPAKPINVRVTLYLVKESVRNQVALYCCRNEKVLFATSRKCHTNGYKAREQLHDRLKPISAYVCQALSSLSHKPGHNGMQILWKRVNNVYMLFRRCIGIKNKVGRDFELYA